MCARSESGREGRVERNSLLSIYYMFCFWWCSGTVDSDKERGSRKVVKLFVIRRYSCRASKSINHSEAVYYERMLSEEAKDSVQRRSL
jgi:hypothetical protein